MLVPFLMIGLAVVLAVVDQIIKAVVVQNLKPIGTYVVIEGLLASDAGDSDSALSLPSS